MTRRKLIKLSLLILLIVIIILGYASHVFQYFYVSTTGRINLSTNKEAILKFKSFPNDNLYYSFRIHGQDSSVIFISDSIPDYRSFFNSNVLKLNCDSINENYSLSPQNILTINRGDTTIAYKKWEIYFKGHNDSTSVLKGFSKLNFKQIITQLKSINCHSLNGGKNDLMLIYNKSIYMQIGCITQNWYCYHYYLGRPSTLDSLNISYNRDDSGILYGWW